MKGEFTGKHMAVIVVSGFAVVIAVNLLMATLAVRGFGGVIVENSYVASQEFNGWLHEAERQKALGWTAEVSRSNNGRLVVETGAVPQGADVTAVARRPLGKPQMTSLGFDQIEPGRLVSRKALEPGRWIVRLRIEFEGRTWSAEQHLS